jgi:hypothetical protein
MKIGLPQRDDLFARIAVLHDEITGVAREFVINLFTLGAAPDGDHFADLNKMVIDRDAAVLAGKHGPFEHL